MKKLISLGKGDVQGGDLNISLSYKNAVIGNNIYFKDVKFLETAIRTIPLFLYDEMNLPNGLSDETLQKAYHTLKTHSILQKTKIVDSGLWQDNIIANNQFFHLSGDLSELSNVILGGDIIFVAAGPSLENSYDFIRKHREHATIISVNTSTGPLLKEGIIPDVVLAGDPREGVELGFCNMDTSQIKALICTMFVYPETFKRFVGRTFTSVLNNESAYYIRRKSGLPSAASMRELGTIASCIFDVAEILGAERVFLVGQDLCFGPKLEAHAEQCYNGQDKVLDEGLYTMPGNHGKAVKTDAVLLSYNGLIASLSRESNLEVYNLTQNGAVIANTKFLTFKQADDLFTKNIVFPDSAKLVPSNRQQFKFDMLLELCEKLIRAKNELEVKALFLEFPEETDFLKDGLFRKLMWEAIKNSENKNKLFDITQKVSTHIKNKILN